MQNAICVTALNNKMNVDFTSEARARWQLVLLAVALSACVLRCSGPAGGTPDLDETSDLGSDGVGPSKDADATLPTDATPLVDISDHLELDSPGDEVRDQFELEDMGEEAKDADGQPSDTHEITEEECFPSSACIGAAWEGGGCVLSVLSEIPGCCETDGDCEDGHACTLDWCDPGTHMCMPSYVGATSGDGMCCMTSADCLVDGSVEKAFCDFGKCEIVYTGECQADSDCTVTSLSITWCGFDNTCKYQYEIVGCLSDLDCYLPLLSDLNPCTHKVCDVSYGVPGQCVFTFIENCQWSHP